MEASVEKCEGSRRATTGRTDSKKVQKVCKIVKNELSLRSSLAGWTSRIQHASEYHERTSRYSDLHEICARLHTTSRSYFSFWQTQHGCGPNPPYSPDLTACELSLFPRMKSLLRGHRFQVVPEIQQRSLTVLHAIPKNQLQRCLQPWQKH